MSKKSKMSNFSLKKDRGSLAKLIEKLYAIRLKSVRTSLLRFLYRYLGKNVEYFSTTLRRIFRKYYDIEIGMYSHGGCFRIGHLLPGTKLGKYSSIAPTAYVLNLSHPTNLISSHAFFFNPLIGFSKTDLMPPTKTVIGNDVWIGHNAIILPSCSSIGDGAVIAAGAVVNKDIQPYAVVIGNPARVVRFRFPPEKIEELLKNRWWDKSIEEILPEFEKYQQPLTGKEVR